MTNRYQLVREERGFTGWRVTCADCGQTITFLTEDYGQALLVRLPWGQRTRRFPLKGLDSHQCAKVRRPKAQTLSVAQLIELLRKATNPDAPVTVLDKPADFEANIALVDEDGENVHIVIEQWPNL